MNTDTPHPVLNAEHFARLPACVSHRSDQEVVLAFVVVHVSYLAIRQFTAWGSGRQANTSTSLPVPLWFCSRLPRYQGGHVYNATRHRFEGYYPQYTWRNPVQVIGQTGLVVYAHSPAWKNDSHKLWSRPFTFTQNP